MGRPSPVGADCEERPQAFRMGGAAVEPAAGAASREPVVRVARAGLMQVLAPRSRRPARLALATRVGVIGAGLAGMATAARLQARGMSTVVFEAHGQPGGCAGFYRRRGFSFDVGATTLVDFEPGGVGHELLSSVGMPPLDGEALPGYLAWLPDRVVTLHRNPDAWHRERLLSFGDTPSHRDFWHFLD